MRPMTATTLGAIAAVAWLGLLTGFYAAYHNAKIDARDPRCDTAARYQAMSEGATCL